jgi:glutamate---cysteine ligase / carboxylate-amine ligase
MSDNKWGLFERYGIELEYMICDKNTLDILPIADDLIFEVAGAYVNEIAAGEISYSNELALHLIELKTTEPQKDLEQVAHHFQEHVSRLNKILQKKGACLLPTGMHPWMNPHTELRIWTHGQNPIYEAYHRIFDCRGHGWANLQSAHFNLSFSTDEELKLLHSAIRWLLPIIPALSASSPVADNVITGFCDTRLEMYRKNQRKIPSIIGQIVPEPIATKEEYFQKILRPMWRDIAPYDPEGLLQEEWLNSRGAIVRFERNAIEIRVLDTQECPGLDVRILKAIDTGLKYLVCRIKNQEISYDAIPTQELSRLFLRIIKEGEKTQIDSREYLELFGQKEPMTATALWDRLAGVKRKSLSRKIAEKWSASSSQEEKQQIYLDLATCLESGIQYGG